MPKTRKPPPSIEKVDLYSLTQIAHKAHVSVRTVRRLVERGELKTHRIGAQIRVSEGDWQAYLARSRQP